MGYSTQFEGILAFAAEPTAAQLGRLNEIFGEDCRDHPEWSAPGLYYIDLELTKDFSGIKWNGAEKTYGMVEFVNLVTRLMREQWPEFRLTGALLAQGEEVGDIWRLVIDDAGIASKQAVAIEGKVVRCPHCEESFIAK